MAVSTPNFQPWCPSGGDWYACGNGTKFTGCCSSYPCTSNGCFAGNLRPSSFNISAYGKFPDQVCAAGQWYTCTETIPAFLGCCVSNPCQQNGCPISDLREGYLSANEQEASSYDPQPPLFSAPDSPIATDTPNSSDAPMTRAATPSTLPSPSSSPLPASNSPSIGTVAGAAAGGAVAVLLAVLFIFLILHRRKRTQQNQIKTKSITGDPLSTTIRSHQNPLLTEHKAPLYTGNFTSSDCVPAELETPAADSPATSPRIIHEAASREVSYMAYSPSSIHLQQHSPLSPSITSSPQFSSQPSTLLGGSERVVSGTQNLHGFPIREGFIGNGL